MKKLKIQLIPDGCWHSNLRYVLSKEQWDYISKYVRKSAGGTCSICGAKTKNLDAHEVFDFDIKKGIQTLKDVIAVCKDCHSAIHMDFTSVKGDIVRAENHYMKVNNCSYVDMKKDLNLAHEKHKTLNRVDAWSLDVHTWLKAFLEL